MYSTSCQEYVAFQYRWSVMAVVSQDRFHCKYIHKKCVPVQCRYVLIQNCVIGTVPVELHQCSGAYRVSPVDVNSRPSSCLTNFLLNGGWAS